MAIEDPEQEEVEITEEADPLAKEFESFRKILQGRVTPEEITDALLIVFQILSMMSEDVDGRIESRGGEISEQLDQVSREIGANEEQHKASHQSLRNLIKGLETWRREIEELGLVDDVASALELAEENSEGLRMIRRELKKLKKNPPKDGKPGRPPAHEWEGSRLRFQNPDGTWGEWVDLRGAPGEAHPERGGQYGGMYELQAGSSNVSIRNGKIFVETSGGSGGHVIEDEGTPFTQRTKLNFVGAGVTVSDDAGDDATVVTIPGGGSGSGVGALAEELTGTQAGSDVTLDLNDLSNSWVAILGVYRNGQLLTPTTSWIVGGQSITIYNADASEDFMVQYTYVSTGSAMSGEVLTGTQSGSNVTLDLTDLAHAWTEIVGVYRNGQLLTPTTSWTRTGNTITVNNADASEDFQVIYVY